MRIINAALSALLLTSLLAAGCGSVPSTEYYEVRCELDPAGEASRALGSSAMVRPFTTVELYARPNVAYRTSPYRLYYDQYREWAAAPGPLVRAQFARCLRRSGLFQTVVQRGFPATAEYHIFGRVLEFYELDQDDHKFAVLALELTLTDANERPLFCITPRAKVQAPPSKDLSGVAEAMSRALGQAFTEFLQTAQKHLPPAQQNTETAP